MGVHQAGEGYTGMQRFPIAEAANRLGISKTAMRRRVERRTVDAIKGNDGQWLVAVPDDEQLPATPPGVPRGTPEPPTRDTPTWDTLAAQLGFLQTQLVEKDRQLAAREREVQELHVMLQTSQRLIPPTTPDAPHVPERPGDDESRVASGTTAHSAPQRDLAASQQLPRRSSWWSRLFGLE